jgi:hypothetical protein
VQLSRTRENCVDARIRAIVIMFASAFASFLILYGRDVFKNDGIAVAARTTMIATTKSSCSKEKPCVLRACSKPRRDEDKTLVFLKMAATFKFWPVLIAGVLLQVNYVGRIMCLHTI